MIIMKKMSKTILTCLFVILLVILNSFFVTSLGVTPARKIVDFQPNTDVKLDFEIINSEKGTFEAGLDASGDASNLIFFEDQTVNVYSNSYRIPFSVIVRFPSEMEPGIHKAMIGISPRLSKPSGNVFVAYVAPQIPILIRVPYPAKYADIRLAVLDVDEGTPVPVYLEFDNLGSEDIARAGGQIEIIMPDGEKIATLMAPNISLSQNTMGKTQAVPSPILRRGFYNAVVDAHYDAVEKSIKTNFTIGVPIVRIRAMETKEIISNQVSKIVFKAYNDWNSRISVKGFIEVDSRQVEMPVFELEPDEEKKAEGFFDTTGFAPGEYNMSITLVYSNQFTTEFYPITIAEAGVEKERVSGLSSLAYIILIIALIIIILIVVLLIIKKKKTTV